MILSLRVCLQHICSSALHNTEVLDIINLFELNPLQSLHPSLPFPAFPPLPSPLLSLHLSLSFPSFHPFPPLPFPPLPSLPFRPINPPLNLTLSQLLWNALGKAAQRNVIHIPIVLGTHS